MTEKIRSIYFDFLYNHLILLPGKKWRLSYTYSLIPLDPNHKDDYLLYTYTTRP